MVFLFVGHLVSNAVTPSRLTWLMTSVPMENRGTFTAVKEMISLAGGILVSLGMGRVADMYRDADGMPTKTYYVICAVTLLLMSVIHIASLLVSNEKPVCEEKNKIRETVLKIAKNKDFLKVIGVGIIWNVASAFSISFFASYLREELAFSFTVIAALSTVGSIARIVMSPLFGKLADKYSFSSSMTIAFVCAAVGFLCVAFTNPETRWLYAAYITMYSFSMAGINSGVINLIDDYVAPSDRAVAMGTKNALGGITAFFVAVFAGIILSAIQGAGGIVLFGITLYAQQFLAIISFVITLILIVYMRLVIAPIKKVD
jgi:Na+/melibiose symporter-like transporter